MKIKFLNFIVVLLLLSPFTSLAQQDVEKRLTVDSIERQYIIHLPPSSTPATQVLPIIFAFHGGGSNYKQAIKFYNLNTLADKKNCIVIYPNAINKAWNIPGISSRVKKLDKNVDDVKFISILLDTIIANYKGNSKKVFCTGISRGGMFSLYLAYKLSDRITAISPVCASISKTVADNYFFTHFIPVLLINGTDDPLVKYMGGTGKFNKRNEDNEDAAMLPTEELINKLVTLNKCLSTPVIKELPDINHSDDCIATEYIYSGKNVTVELIKIINGGHTWPGGSQYLPKFIIGKVCKDFSASEKLIDFFMALQE